MGAPALEPLEAALGHRFRQRRWLELALTHSTGRREAEQDADNERLEFLGDAVVSLVVSEHLAEAFPDWTAGQLSQARAQIVSADSLCRAARALDLGAYLRLGRGEEKTGGRNKPTLLADAYEALIAALYYDAGWEAARDVVQRTLIAPALQDATRPLGQPDAKSALQAFLQSRGRGPAEYRVASETGPDHRKSFRVEVLVAGSAVASAEAGNKKKAEQQAAERALRDLRAAESAT